jgi:hypothetical protein
MANCNVSIGSYVAEDGTLDVLTKYASLMTASLADDSVYERAKETLFHSFTELHLTEKEKAAQVIEFITVFANEATKSSMAMALSWAKEERDGPYELAKLKADTKNSLAAYELTKESVCEMQKRTEHTCMQIKATSAKSIRENGSIAAMEADGCNVKTLNNEGLLYEQIQQVIAATYQTFSDSYRKSGKVVIGKDPVDQIIKGMSGDDNGYTWQQQVNAERQRIAYEDSKINHAANSAATMIGQLLSAEALVASHDQDVERWRNAMDRLLQKHSTTSGS